MTKARYQTIINNGMDCGFLATWCHIVTVCVGAGKLARASGHLRTTHYSKCWKGFFNVLKELNFPNTGHGGIIPVFRIYISRSNNYIPIGEILPLTDKPSSPFLNLGYFRVRLITYTCRSTNGRTLCRGSKSGEKTERPISGWSLRRAVILIRSYILWRISLECNML